LSDRRFTGIFHGGRKFLHFKIHDPFIGLKKNHHIYIGEGPFSVLKKNHHLYIGEGPFSVSK
jgi:hypothetical protein